MTMNNTEIKRSILINLTESRNNVWELYATVISSLTTTTDEEAIEKINDELDTIFRTIVKLDELINGIMETDTEEQ